MRKLLTTAVAAVSAAGAYAGGYVPPVLSAPPVAAAAPSEPRLWWVLPLLALFLWAGKGKNHQFSPTPPDYGGPCFHEDTLILTANCWVPVEDLRAGDTVLTSKGPQVVIEVDSWVPREFKDRAVVIDGVHLSANHRVRDEDGRMVEAGNISTERAPIDGARFYHVLVEHHAWLHACHPSSQRPIMAESLQVTAVTKLGRKHPHLVDIHAANTAGPAA